jgi:3-ketosteroid 9alpha-monooxygenase subunit B
VTVDVGRTDSSGSDQAVLRAHGFHSLRVKRVVQETDDTRSFVLEIPEELSETFQYRAGQFCTFRVSPGEEERLRSYSMSSAPETDAELTVTVKRVAGGLVSNWFVDSVSVGDVLEATRPAGVFCLGDTSRPVVAFCGGSGVTPVISIAKSALETSNRPVRLLYANRSPSSVIFRSSLEELQARHPNRLEVRHHFDSESGFVESLTISNFLEGTLDGDFYICGPDPFMDIVQPTLLDRGVDPDRIFIERFGVDGSPAVLAGPAPTVDLPEADEVTEGVTIVMKGRQTTVDYHAGDTVLETARRGGLNPPFSCESGTCATCMAIVREGSVRMRLNHALTAEEVEEGWTLTCQAMPTGRVLTVEYEAF